MQRKERKKHLRIECSRQVKDLKKDFVSTVSNRLSLPAEALSASPLIQLHGRQCLSVENHGGILEYTDTELKIAVKGGFLRIKGRDLSIGRMSRRCLEIRGRISGLELE